MHPHDHGDEADLRRVAGAARVADRDLAADARLRALLDELHDGVTAAGRPRARRSLRLPAPHRLAPVLAAALTVALVLGGGLALRQSRTDRAPDATSSGTAQPGRTFRTGVFGSAPGFEFRGRPGEHGDGSEWVRLDAPDLPAYLGALQASRPLPPGASWEPLHRQLLLPGKHVQMSYLHLDVIRYAACQWAEAWWDGQRAHRTESVLRAHLALDRLRTYRFVGPGRGNSRADRSYTIIRGAGARLEIQRYRNESCGARWRLTGTPR
ncbi:hypothetical protein [Actinomadura hibisca]|uniref:hypothetical protein n=1 Tax=Actinomadura hibisca TaxID=68565 RepID=UPI000835871C|nr:hypothetical protein [Actinomadura hibisca]